MNVIVTSNRAIGMIILAMLIEELEVVVPSLKYMSIGGESRRGK